MMLLQQTNQSTDLISTELKTLWSETLLEMLYDAFRHNWSPNAVREILVELHRKGYRRPRVMKKLNKQFGEAGPKKLLQILSKTR